MNITGAIFDMDGTLVDSLMVWDFLWESFGKTYINDPSFRPSAQVDKAVRTMTLKDAMNHFHDVYKFGKDGTELFNYATDTMREFYANEVKLKPGVREFLDYCYNKGVKMCIASATDVELLKIAINHCDLSKYFLKIFSCAEIGKGKECPDIYLMTLDYLGTAKESTWVFEDSAVALTTAHDAGFPTVGIYDKYNYGQDILIKNSDFYIPDGQGLDSLID